MKFTTTIPCEVEYEWDPGEKSSWDYPGYSPQPVIQGVQILGPVSNMSICLARLPEKVFRELEEQCQRDYILNERAAEDAAVNAKILAAKEEERDEDVPF